MLGATVTMYAFTILSGNLLKITKPVLENKNNGLKYLFMGTLFGPVIGVTLSLYTVKLLEASIAQTIFSLVPVFVILISAIFYQNKIGLKTYLGLITALSGVFILVWRNYL
jgi:drug/metabolite transporter (DMT)-like permease